MTVHMPHQLFINGEFVDSSNGRTFDAINPTDGSVRQDISVSTVNCFYTPCTLLNSVLDS